MVGRWRLQIGGWALYVVPYMCCAVERGLLCDAQSIAWAILWLWCEILGWAAFAALPKVSLCLLVIMTFNRHSSETTHINDTHCPFVHWRRYNLHSAFYWLCAIEAEILQREWCACI